MKIRTIFCLPLLLIASALQAEQPQMEALEAWADADAGLLMIAGRNFNNGNVLEVQIAGRLPVEIVDPLADYIEIPLPSDLEPGTYTVFISTGGGTIRYDEIDFTWGAVGLQGLQGEPGGNGADGLPGVDGQDGALGPQGDDGPQGDLGEPGTPGAPGSDGLDGATGPRGEQGPIGPKGLQGEQGLPGLDGEPGADPEARDGVCQLYEMMDLQQQQPGFCSSGPICPITTPEECSAGCSNGTCVIDCIAGVCDGYHIVCPPGLDCSVLYEGTDPTSTFIYCPDNYACALDCLHAGTDGPILECGGSSDCTNSCNFAPSEHLTCVSPGVVGQLPFVGVEYLTGPAHVWAFTPYQTGLHQFVVNSPTLDTVLSIVLDCADVENSLLAISDNAGSGGEEVLIQDMSEGLTHYILVYGYSSTSVGEYELFVDGPL